jgi:hypothetical protein
MCFSFENIKMCHFCLKMFEYQRVGEQQCYESTWMGRGIFGSCGQVAAIKTIVETAVCPACASIFR